MTGIVVLHPGAMGAAVGETLREAGHDVGWMAAGRSPATRARAEAAGLSDRAYVAGAEIVISLVPPAAALATAHAVVGFSGLFVDANAISPERAVEVAAVVRDGGATYVDASVVGPPPVATGTTRLYLSGDAASLIADVFAGTRLEPVVVSGGEFGASAVKMAYASWTKISAALVLAADHTAQAYGVAEALYAEWGRSVPDALPRLERARVAAAEKGWRWTDEMRQIAATFASAGESAGFGEAAAAVYERYPRP